MEEKKWDLEEKMWKETEKIEKAQKNRDSKVEVSKKEYINKQKELQEAILKVTMEKEEELKNMLEKA